MQRGECADPFEWLVGPVIEDEEENMAEEFGV